MNRRTFLALPATLVPLGPRQERRERQGQGSGPVVDLVAVERSRILRAADRYLREDPVTIAASNSPRSAGGPHDYFSDDNFTDHRLALIRLSLQVPALAAAWTVTRDRRYASHAGRHLHAWFLDAATRMNPDLRYAQTMKGRDTSRGTGIIDTVHLVEVARAIGVLESANVMSLQERADVKEWFSKYLTWLTTHQYGIQERNTKNHRATCWVMQVAEFARLTGHDRLTAFCRARFKTVLLPTQMAADGSFPQELASTKAYGDSLLNLDAMATICQILSGAEGGAAADNLWLFRLPDGRGMGKAMEFMSPYISDKGQWPHAPDAMYFDQWPIRHPSLLFAGLALKEAEYLSIWRRLDPDPSADAVIRNFVVRQPLLWIPPLSAIPVK